MGAAVLAPVTFVVKLGRRTVGTFDDIGAAKDALIAARGPGSHEGHILCRMVVVRCEAEGATDEATGRPQLCWGQRRPHGPASDASMLCEGHFAAAEGRGYLAPPQASVRGTGA